MTFLILIFSIIGLNNFAQAAEKSLYNFNWLDDDEQVFVIQNKEFSKKGRLGLDLGIIQSDNSPYYDSLGYQAEINYYFTETFSIDITRKQYNNKESKDLKNLLEAYATQTKPLLTVVDSSTLLHLNWIPFYGKINTFNKIFYFDFGFGLGGGQFETRNNFKTFKFTNVPFVLDKESSTGGNFKVFTKFFTDSGITFGVAYNLSGYSTIKSHDGKKELDYYVDILATLGYIF